MNSLKQFFQIPSGRFAADDAAAKARREALRAKLLNGGTITLSNNNSANGSSSTDSSITIPKGKLADDAAAKARRDALRNKLLNGSKVTLNNGGGNSIDVPPGKLAVQQWYEKNPELLALEKVSMRKSFPDFELEHLEDGSLAWVGKLNIGIYESKFNVPMEYHVMALYMANHPHAQMGSSVRIYPILPNVDELIEKCGFRPYHLLRDSNDDIYLCTNEAGDQKVGREVTSAASSLAWASKWFLAYELVLTGDLSKDKFNQHGGI